MATRTILRHEWRLLSRSRAAAASLVVLSGLVVYGAWAGVQWRQEQLATIARLVAHDQAQSLAIARQLGALKAAGNPRPAIPQAGLAWYLAQPDGAEAPAPHVDARRPEAAASEWVGARHAWLPPAPFSALAIGQSDLHPYYSRVSIRTSPVLVQADEIENPTHLLVGRVDLAFMLTVCFPVLLFPLVYDIASQERESGTLAMLAAQPIALRRLLLWRLAVRVGATVLVALSGSLLALGAFGGLDGVSARGQLGWAAIVTAAGLFWGGLAFLTNAMRWSSSANCAALLVAWLLLVVTAPAVIGEVAQTLAPVPSRVEVITAVRLAGSLDADALRALVSAYHEAHPEAATATDAADVSAVRSLVQQEEVSRRIEPVVHAYRAAVTRQQTLTDRLRYVSPALLLHEATTELAGTSGQRQRAFAAQLDAYQRSWRRYFTPMVHARVVLSHADYARAPTFSFEEEPAGATLRQVGGLVAVTSGIGAFLLVLGLRRL